MADSERTPRQPDPNISHPTGQTPVLPPNSSGDGTTPPDEETIVGPHSADGARKTLDLTACNDSATPPADVPHVDYLWTEVSDTGTSPLEERTEIQPALDPSAVDQSSRTKQIRI